MAWGGQAGMHSPQATHLPASKLTIQVSRSTSSASVGQTARQAPQWVHRASVRVTSRSSGSTRTPCSLRNLIPFLYSLSGPERSSTTRPSSSGVTSALTIEKQTSNSLARRQTIGRSQICRGKCRTILWATSVVTVPSSVLFRALVERLQRDARARPRQRLGGLGEREFPGRDPVL